MRLRARAATRAAFLRALDRRSHPPVHAELICTQRGVSSFNWTPSALSS